jgi:hypothetical protein
MVINLRGIYFDNCINVRFSCDIFVPFREVTLRTQHLLRYNYPLERTAPNSAMVEAR